MSKPSQRYILSFWVPLALSWLMMSIASPVVNAGVSRLPNPTVGLAAYGVALDIAILLESPIIMLLSTSVALVRNRATYLMVRRFTIHFVALVTALSLFVSFTPAYDVLFRSILGLPEEVAAAAQPAMRILLLWPAAIGWRRFYQGILIQHGYTRVVTWGTGCRLATLVATVAIGVWVGGIPGATLGGLGLMLSVAVEAFVITWWAWPVAREYIWGRDESRDPPMRELTYARLWRFYLPLAMTDVMRIISRPVVVAGIARAALPQLSLAAWPVGLGLATMVSSSTQAFQEVVVALLDNDSSYLALRRFVLTTGVVFSGILAIIVYTPLRDFYFLELMSLPLEVEPLAANATLVMFLLPLLFAWRNLYRGQLIRYDQTGHIQFAMGANFFSLVAILIVGTWMGGLSGVLLAAVATVIAQGIEVVVLYAKSRSVVREGAHAQAVGDTTTVGSEPSVAMGSAQSCSGHAACAAPTESRRE